MRLKVHEIYLSIQGESSFAGLPCVFVRTTGCPLRCSYCDTTHAFYEGYETTVDEVIEKVVTYGSDPLIEITGGEPLIQPHVFDLMTKLCDLNRQVLLETSGAFDISKVDERVHIIMDIKCPSSNEVERNQYQNIDYLSSEKDEVKFVIADREDYLFTKEMIQKYNLEKKSKILLSTVFGTIKNEDVVDWMLSDRLKARFQLQMHKMIWPPDAKGV